MDRRKGENDMSRRTEEIFMLDCGNFVINTKKIRYVEADTTGECEAIIHLDRGEALRIPKYCSYDHGPTIWEQLNAFNPMKRTMSNRWEEDESDE